MQSKALTPQALNKARTELEKAAALLDKFIPDKSKRDQVKAHLVRVDDFHEKLSNEISADEEQ